MVKFCRALERKVIYHMFQLKGAGTFVINMKRDPAHGEGIGAGGWSTLLTIIPLEETLGRDLKS